MKFRLIIALSLIMGVTGCMSLPKPTSTIRVINTNVYPEMPDIEPVDDPNLAPFQADVPRDLSVLSVKNLTACRVDTIEDPDRPWVILPTEEQSSNWWSRCGEHPVVPDSNIFLGFDQDNWYIIVENFAKLKEALHRYKARIDEINRQRAEWRRKALEESQKNLITDQEDE